MNEGTISDYIDLQRMMFMLNESYRSKSFNIFGGGSVASQFRRVVADFERENSPELYTTSDSVRSIPSDGGSGLSHLAIGSEGL